MNTVDLWLGTLTGSKRYGFVQVSLTCVLAIACRYMTKGCSAAPVEDGRSRAPLECMPDLSQSFSVLVYSATSHPSLQRIMYIQRFNLLT